MCKSKKYRYKTYIYGMGNEYNRLSSYLKLYKEKLDILGIVTTEKQVTSKIDGYSCITVEEINKNEMDYIIIAVSKWREVLDILRQYEIEEEKIIRSTVFYYPHFNLDDYLRLKSNNITILSNFCLGG